MTAAHWLALNGGNVPMPDELDRVESFSRIMKLEPFERGMSDSRPTVWITALRREQNPQRAATLQPVMWDEKFHCLKVNPHSRLDSVEMDAYLAEFALPERAHLLRSRQGRRKTRMRTARKLVTDKYDRLTVAT